MKDLFDDSLFTPPEKPKVPTLCRFTAMGEAELYKAMRGPKGRVHSPMKEPKVCRCSDPEETSPRMYMDLESDIEIFKIISKTKTIVSAQLSEILNISRDAANKRMSRMAKRGFLKREALLAPLIGWEYSLPDTK